MAKTRGLTDADIAKGLKEAKASGRTIILRDTGRTPGLQMVITAAGTASWSLLFTPKGHDRPKRLKLGRHQHGFGLVQARLAVGELRNKIAHGLDPAVERQQRAVEERAKLAALRAEEAARKEKVEAAARRMSIRQLANLYFAARARESGMKRAREIIEFSVIPILGDVIVEEIRKVDLQRVIDSVVARGNTVQAHRALEAFRPMLKWALDRDYLPADRDGFWKKLNLPRKGEPRERVLRAREIKWLWEQCGAWAKTDPNLCWIVQLDILLGQRSTETCEMAREEIAANGRTWTLPGAKTKNGKPHLVPLPPMASAIVAEALASIPSDQEQLFVGPRGAVLRSDYVAHEFARAVAAWNELRPNDPIEPFTPHDLRRTMATRLEESGTSITIIETALNHISNKSGSVTRRHYAHGDLSLSVRHALAKWQGLVELCLAGHDPFEVKAEDIDAIEARALAEAHGGKPKLQIVG